MLRLTAGLLLAALAAVHAQSTATFLPGGKVVQVKDTAGVLTGFNVAQLPLYCVDASCAMVSVCSGGYFYSNKTVLIVATFSTPDAVVMLPTQLPADGVRFGTGLCCCTASAGYTNGGVVYWR